MDASKYYKPELCTECGGRCCSVCGGIFAPEQFEDLSVDGLVKAIKDLDLSIDWWEGCPEGSGRARTLYLRTRNKDRPVIDPTWSSAECTAFIPGKGCRFSFEDRPCECQSLIPNKEGDDFVCYIPEEDEANKKGLSIRWIPYQQILFEVSTFF